MDASLESLFEVTNFAIINQFKTAIRRQKSLYE